MKLPKPKPVKVRAPRFPQPRMHAGDAMPQVPQKRGFTLGIRKK